jgi:hypothetical protein
MAQVNLRQRDWGDRLNHLNWLTVDQHEIRSPCLVAANNFSERATESRHIYSAARTDGDRFVVDWQTGDHLRMQPDLLLRERQWRRLAVHRRPNATVEWLFGKPQSRLVDLCSTLHFRLIVSLIG